MSATSRMKKIAKQIVPKPAKKVLDAILWGCFPEYDSDGMRLYGKSTQFLQEERFQKAYQAGVNSGHNLGRASKQDIHVEWRVHMACWAASHAMKLPGDLVECGVNTGIFSLAICNYVDFNSSDKSFYLFDTYCGIPESQMKEEEKQSRKIMNARMYVDCYETTKRNFAPFPRAQLVRGMVPQTLNDVKIDKVSYLSIDMNIAEPEIAAMNFFWDKLSPSAPVLLDDYAFAGHGEQKRLMDEFAAEKGVCIATLPTGQGLLLKP